MVIAITAQQARFLRGRIGNWLTSYETLSYTSVRMLRKIGIQISKTDSDIAIFIPRVTAKTITDLLRIDLEESQLERKEIIDAVDIIQSIEAE